MGKMHRSIGDGWNMVSEISADDGPSIGRRKNDRRPMSLLVRFMRLHPKDDVIPRASVASRMLYIQPSRIHCHRQRNRRTGKA